eukprot:2644857-Karenia_brevis.AAC.1
MPEIPHVDETLVDGANHEDVPCSQPSGPNPDVETLIPDLPEINTMKAMGGAEGPHEPLGFMGRTHLNESELRSITKYAEYHGVDVGNVTIQQVWESPEGIGHWATVGLNLNRRSDIGQCFGRAIGHNFQARKIYADLSDEEKLNFRQN